MLPVVAEIRSSLSRHCKRAVYEVCSEMKKSALLLSMYWAVIESDFQRNSCNGSVTAFSSYGSVFPPIDPAFVPALNRDNATIITLCELWENDSIPVAPGVELALRRIRPYFLTKNMDFEVLRQRIPSGCGDETILAATPALVDMHLNRTRSKHGCSLIIGPSCTESMYSIRGLAMNWNIPVVTSGASGIKFEDKNRTKVLTRFGYTQEDVSLFLIKVLDHYQWTHIVVVSAEVKFPVLATGTVRFVVNLAKPQFLFLGSSFM